LSKGVRTFSKTVIFIHAGLASVLENDMAIYKKQEKLMRPSFILSQARDLHFSYVFFSPNYHEATIPVFKFK
jgi:hypothetical protein